MGQTTLVYRKIKFDSDEEVFVAMWLQELKEAGYVKKWDRSTTPIQMTQGFKIPYIKTTVLKTKTKKEKKEYTVLRPSEYTPDFEVIWTFEGWDVFVSPLMDGPLFNTEKLFLSEFYDKPTLIEVKPSFFDQNNMERLFRLNQKWIWDKHKIFVNLIDPITLFKKTFMPKECECFFKYKKLPSSGPNKGKVKVGDWKMTWKPRSYKDFEMSII